MLFKFSFYFKHFKLCYKRITFLTADLFTENYNKQQKNWLKVKYISTDSFLLSCKISWTRKHVKHVNTNVIIFTATFDFPVGKKKMFCKYHKNYMYKILYDLTNLSTWLNLIF